MIVVGERREALINELMRVREFTRSAYAHLSDVALIFPQQPEINLPLWELAHVAWFQEYWCVRYPHSHAVASVMPMADPYYNSSLIPHAARWQLPLPPRTEVLRYLDETFARTCAALKNAPTQRQYFYELSLWHECMHVEALLMSLHTLGYPAPSVTQGTTTARGATEPARDVVFDAARFDLGSSPADAQRFVFDNEKWAHDVTLPRFAMRTTLTTCGEYARYLEATDAPAPRDWRRSTRGTWEVRTYDTWATLQPDAALRNVSAHEAENYCAWAKRRLPTEAEWEYALLTAPGQFADAFDVVWQWTASIFAPYPGFAPDPYADYSAPWFDGQHRVLRGSSFATAPGMAHEKFRNFYQPHRRDVFAGFRTCALGEDT